MADAEAPEEFHCPITHQVMLDPVVDAHGDTYDREAIRNWYQEHNKSPLSGVVLAEHERAILIPNRALRSQIQTWLDKHPEQREDLQQQADTSQQLDQQQSQQLTRLTARRRTPAPAPTVPTAPTAQSLSRPPTAFHDSQREEMHWRGRRWYSALPAETRRRWDELQHGASCDVQLMIEMQGDDYGRHKELLFKALGDLDGDGILTPDEMRAVLYISSNFMACSICQGPILLLDGVTCFDCMEPPFRTGELDRPWVCGGCVEDTRRGRPPAARWGTTCPCTQRQHDLEELMDIRVALQLKLSAGRVRRSVVRRLRPLDTFKMDLPFLLEHLRDGRRVLMLRCALGLAIPPDFQDEEGVTPLHVAALCEDKDSIRFLLITADNPELYAHTVLQGLEGVSARMGVQQGDASGTRGYIEEVLEECRAL